MCLCWEGAAIPDYREIKKRYEPQIESLERKKRELSLVNENLMAYLRSAVDVLRNLAAYYNKASLPIQQKIMGSIFKEKLIFQKEGYRTNGYNEVIERIHLLDKASIHPKNGQASKNGSLSEEVTAIGFKPITF
jgi:hypothetical protein